MHRHKQHVRLRDRGRQRRRPAEQVLSEVIRATYADKPGPLVIAVGGPGGTGKSTFAARLAERLGDAAVLRLDDYKTARAVRQQAGLFGPHPQANRMDLITTHLAHLRRGQPFDKPVYDSAIGDAGATESHQPVRFNIIDGEVATYRELRDLVDFSIFIDSDWRTQLATRLGRDVEKRNYSPEKAVATFLHSNLREFSEHGAESKKWADVHLFCCDDYRLELESVSQDLYEQVRGLLREDVEIVELAGLIVPLLTPFAATGAIDGRAFAEHLDFLAGAGVRRVLVGGTTGEFFSLMTQERLDLLKLALEYFPGLVLFQAGGGALGETVHLARRAQQLRPTAFSACRRATMRMRRPRGSWRISVPSRMPSTSHCSSPTSPATRRTPLRRPSSGRSITSASRIQPVTCHSSRQRLVILSATTPASSGTLQLVGQFGRQGCDAEQIRLARFHQIYTRTIGQLP